MRWLASFAFIVLAAGFAAAQPPPTRVAVAKVFEKQLAPTTSLVGIVDFDQSAGISSEISGLIESHRMVEGAVVRKGDVLLQLNTDFTRKDIALIEQQIAQVEIQIENKQKNLNRFETLFRQDATSEKNYDDLAFGLREMLVDRERLRISLSKKRLELEKSRIQAPFNGLVLGRYKNQGEWIAPGVPICLLAAVDDAVVRVPLSEDLMPYVKLGQAVTLTIPAMNKKITGTVAAVVPQVNIKSKTFDVKIDITYADGLFQNMSAQVNVPTGPTRRLKMIPRDALVRVQGKTFVYTVEAGKAKMLPIETLAVDGEWLGVEAPYIVAGMPLVVDGNERLQPDQAVQVVDAPGHVPAIGEKATE